MGTLAHTLEAEGISTVALSAIRGVTEKLKPPRALHCEFPLGRPLGKPLDADYQKNVLTAAFELLKQTEGPVLIDFPDTIEDSSDEALSCNLPPRDDTDQHPALAEAKALRGAYDRNLAGAGHTNVGRVGDADAIPELVECFIKIADGTSWKEAGIPTGNILEATKDMMSYYEEAGAELAGHTPAARSAESWFFKQTEGGKLLIAVRAAMKEAKVPFWMYITPMGV